MLTYKDFNKKEEITVDDFPAALKVCQKIRESDKNRLYIVRIKQSVNRGPFKFPYSNFCLISNNATITGDKYGKQLDESGTENTTWRTATLTVTGSNNIFVNFTIENTALNPSKKGTSVALSVFGDKNTFQSCSISSTQDTLFIGPLPDDLATRYIGFIPEDERLVEGNLRNYFINSKISGSVDFIFGAGQAVFSTCLIESVEDGRMGISYVTAPAHSLKDSFGFLFYDCSFVSSSILCQRVYLSRPWRDYGKCAFINCTYGQHIKSEGFTDWSASSFRYLTARYLEYPLRQGRVNWMFNSKQPEICLDYLKAIEELKSK